MQLINSLKVQYVGRYSPSVGRTGYLRMYMTKTTASPPTKDYHFTMPRRTHHVSDGSLPDTHLIPHSPTLRKLLLRPSKNTLCEVVLEWLENVLLGKPHPQPESPDGHSEDGTGELSIDELKKVYEEMKTSHKATRKTVVERIVERDWVPSLL